MPTYFDSLPSETDMGAVVNAVREIIIELHENGKKTYSAISDMAFDLLARRVDPVAIKVFLNSTSTRFNKNNSALPILYDLIRSKFQDFPDAARERAVFH